MAQSNVYSLNVVGYVNKPMLKGYSLIANPLSAPTNTLSATIPNPPEGTTFLGWKAAGGYDLKTFAFGSWDADLPLAPGGGGFINPPSNFTNTFVGDVMQGALTNAYPKGYSVRSSMVPQADTVVNLGLTVGDSDTLLKWNITTQKFAIYTFAFGAWDPSVPSLDIGESAFLNTGAAGNWIRNFTVQ